MAKKERPKFEEDSVNIEALIDKAVEQDKAASKTETKKEKITKKAMPEVVGAAEEVKEKPKKAVKKTLTPRLRSGQAKNKKPHLRSKKYKEILDKFDRNKKYPIEDAIKLVKQLSYSKFDGTVNLAVRLQVGKKAEEGIRGTIRLPHGAGRSLKVEIATDELIEKIKKGDMGFDLLIATPAMMPKLAQVAKILGPKGKMPNPKDGTVVDDPKVVIEDLSSKVVGYRTDIGHNIHVPIGKVSWEGEKIAENLQTVLKALAHLKKDSVTLSPTMGPGVKVEVK